MADINANDPIGRSDGRPGSSQSSSSGGGAGLADQARDTLRTASRAASDSFDNASEYGSRYYRQGSRAVGDVETATMVGLFVAGAIGFGLGWLVFGEKSRSGDYIPERMSRSSERGY